MAIFGEGWLWNLARGSFLCALILFLIIFLLNISRKQNPTWAHGVLVTMVLIAGILWVIVPWVMQHRATQFREWESALKPGMEAYQAQQYKEAIPVFTNAVVSFPEAALVHLRLGESYREIGKNKLAEEAYLHVLEIMDTGHWVVKARKALQEMGSSNPLVTDPAHSVITLQTEKNQQSPVRRSLVSIIIAFYRLSALLVALGVAWLMYAAYVTDNDDGPLIYMAIGLVLMYMCGAWVLTRSCGAFHESWYTGFAGWSPNQLMLKTSAFVILAILLLLIVIAEPKWTFRIMFGVLVIGGICLAIVFWQDRSAKVAILTAQMISLVSVVWGAGAILNLGDLSETPVLRALTRSIIAIFAWLLLPVAAHIVVFFKIMPWLAVQRNWSIPSYFWESTVIQWIQNVSGGLL